MTVTASGLVLYAGALLILFVTPGPVWVALLARSLSGGFAAAWPLAVGVALGDIFWPLVAILGVTWLVSAFAEVMLVMKWIAVAVFIFMGIGLIRSGGHALRADSRLTRPGRWAGFVAGVAVILGSIGANFGAGMTGGMAYLYDPKGMSAPLINMESLVTCPVTVAHWHDQLKGLIERHAKETGSRKAADILQHWDVEKAHFVQVCPKEMLIHLKHPLTIAQTAIPAE